MSKIWGLGIIATLTCGAGLTQFACSAGNNGSTSPASEVGDPKIEELIGSVPINSASLDGIGAIGFSYDSGSGGAPSAGAPGVGSAGFAAGPIPTASGGFSEIPASGGGGGTPFQFFSAQCTGTLLSKSSVLTSRSCGQLLQQAYPPTSTLEFAIGADSTQPKRLIDVVDVEFAPVDATNGVAPDIAVLHLAESVTDVAVFPTALLTDDLIGKQLAAVGYGNSDLRYQSGARRAGALTLQATSGPLYPAIFGSFDAFYQYESGGGSYGAGGGIGLGQPAAAGAGNLGGAGAGAVTGGAPNGASGGVAGGGGDDGYLQYLHQQYDDTLLDPGAAYLGGTDADAQPCGADQGGPVVRKLQNKVRVLGVFSHTPFGSCDKGGIYAGITDATKTFIDTAAQWKDPCAATTVNGSCVGSTATRCSTLAEGKRRLVKFDCALLNQACVGGGNTEVACTDK